MNYQTHPTHPDLAGLVKLHWTLEVPAEARSRQRILPDGCVDLIFILADDIRRILPTGEGVKQPRAMVLGQITEAFDVEPEGRVDSFATRFHPYGASAFLNVPLKQLMNKETPLAEVFGPGVSSELQRDVLTARDTEERIAVVERFLLERMKARRFKEDLVRRTVDLMLQTGGSTPIASLADHDPARRRKMERMFNERIGTSPKQLSKVIRLQTALRRMLDAKAQDLTGIAYESEFYDQAHFIKDFKEFAGVSPGEFFDHGMMALSARLYKPQ